MTMLLSRCYLLLLPISVTILLSLCYVLLFTSSVTILLSRRYLLLIANNMPILSCRYYLLLLTNCQWQLFFYILLVAKCLMRYIYNKNDILTHEIL